MITGTIVRLDPRRGEALIQPHDGDLPPVAMPLRPDLELGARVEYLIETDRVGRRRAVDIHPDPEGPSPMTAPTPAAS